MLLDMRILRHEHFSILGDAFISFSNSFLREFCLIPGILLPKSSPNFTPKTSIDLHRIMAIHGSSPCNPTKFGCSHVGPHVSMNSHAPYVLPLALGLKALEWLGSWKVDGCCFSVWKGWIHIINQWLLINPKVFFFFERFIYCIYLGSNPSPNPVTQWQMKGFRLGFFMDSLLKLSVIILNPGDDSILGG